MKDYRLYLLDLEGRIRKALAYECDDDHTAIESAREMERAAYVVPAQPFVARTEETAQTSAF